MAIVRMKKLRILVCEDQCDALMRELALLGSVELRDPKEALDDLRTLDLVHKRDPGFNRYRAERARVSDALRILEKYAPEKKPLLSAKPQITLEEFLRDKSVLKSLDEADEIISLDEKIRNCYQEELRITSLMENLKPWEPLQIPVDCNGTDHVAILIGTMPIMSDYAGLAAEMDEALNGETELMEINTDEHTRFLCVFYVRADEVKALEILRKHGFSLPVFENITGYAADNLARLEDELHELAKQRKLLTAQIAIMGDDRSLMKLNYDRMDLKETGADAKVFLLDCGSLACMEGWLRADGETALQEVLGRYDCAWDFSDPAEEEYPDVPVKLKNNAVTDSLNMVTNMYSLPQYGTVDPNPLMAPFFIVFYGIMMADMGYGLLMVIAALVAMKRLRPREGTLSFCRLLLYCGITTFLMGALTGGLFGDAPYQVAHILNPASTWEGLPALFSPLNDSIYVLVGAIVLGFIHLNTGLAVSFAEKLKHGETADAILYEGALWVIAIGIGLFVLKIGNIAGVPVVLVIGVLMLFAGAVRGKKGFGILTSVFSTLYNELTGWFGDLLSYSRIMALMLAGSVIGQVFNTIGAMFGNLFLFIPIFLIGHALNFGLNLLGCYVHDLRLQCLEFFGKFYVDGGKPFRPLRIKTKFVDIKDK